MAIPVQNIYYLLLYAWGHFKGGETVDVGSDTSPDLPNLLADVLNNGVHRLLRRGLDRDYLQFTEETRSPRGKLRIDVMTKQQTLLRGMAVCDLDELETDVLHNRIIKTSLLRLARCADVDKKLRHELLASARRMPGVDTTRLTADVFGRVQLSRNTRQYGLLLRVCELLTHVLMPDTNGSGSKFQDILENEERMAKLFEDFLRQFYQRELPGFTSRSEIMNWDATPIDDSDANLIPIMKTDITLRSPDQVIIIDAKFYKDALMSGPYSNLKIRSDHLYQLNAYLQHEARQQLMKPVSGMLLYPSNGRLIRQRYKMLGIPVTIASVDLSAPWQGIHAELLGLIHSIAQPAAHP